MIANPSQRGAEQPQKFPEDRDINVKIYQSLLAFIGHFILVALNRESADQQTHHHCHVKNANY